MIIARLRISDAGMPIYLLGWRHPLPNPPPLRGRGVLRPFSRAAGEGWGGVPGSLRRNRLLLGERTIHLIP